MDKDWKVVYISLWRNLMLRVTIHIEVFNHFGKEVFTMDIIIGMVVTFCLLIISIFKGIFVGYPLLLGYLIFTIISLVRGFKWTQVLTMSITGSKKAFVVLRIFVLIGAITGIWMASGTVPAIIYYGIEYMSADFFVLYTFLITCVVSFLLGTSLGTVSTVGIALILIAKTGSANLNVVAGAIIAGAYFGDRCSPMSSSANLVASLTKTNVYINIKNMFITSIIPFVLSVVIYYFLSLQHPLNVIQNTITTDIMNTFVINWVVLLPAIIILVFSLFKINVKTSMLVSILLASGIALALQQYNPLEVVQYMSLGFRLDSSNPLASILKGGGIISMWKASLVVFISCSLSGLFEGTNMLKNIEDILLRANSRFTLFLLTTATSIITAVIGCNQTISIVLSHHFMHKSYENTKVDNYQLAVDLENTGVVLAALIPWNIAALVPTMTMGIDSAGFIPYAFYLYLIPITNVFYLKFLEVRNKKKLSTSVVSYRST